MADTLSAVTRKAKRQPRRFAVRRVEATAGRSSFFRCESADYANWNLSPRVRAVLDASPATCRYPTGEGREDFAYCGQTATVLASSAFGYCAGCAKVMYGPYVSPDSSGLSRPPRGLAARRFIGG